MDEVTNREAFIAILDVVHEVPLMVYEDGELGIVAQYDAQNTVLKYIDVVAKRFVAKR
jgi:hypothetical protein